MCGEEETEVDEMKEMVNEIIGEFKWLGADELESRIFGKKEG